MRNLLALLLFTAVAPAAEKVVDPLAGLDARELHNRGTQRLAEGDLRGLAAQVSCTQSIAGNSVASLGMISDFERSLAEDGPDGRAIGLSFFARWSA